jgi:hypothetical protein
MTNQPTGMLAGALAVTLILNDREEGEAASTATPLCGFWMVASTMLEVVIPPA